MKIEIINWEKYNPRRDQKTHHWFRLNNDLFSHSKFLELSGNHIIVLVYCLCEASKCQANVIEVPLKCLPSVIRVRRSAIIKALSLLKQRGTINFDDTDLCSTLHNRTLHNRTTHNNSEAGPSNTDLLQKKGKEKTLRGTSLREESPAKSGKGIKPISHVSEVKDAFLAAYEAEFKTPYPAWGAKENGQAAGWLRSVSLVKALQYCALYPKWNDPWISRQGHPFGLLIAQYVKLDAWLSREASIIEKIAEGQARESVVLGKAQSFRELEMHVDESYKRREAENLIRGRTREDKLSGGTQAVLSGGGDDVFSRDPFTNCAPEPNGFEPSDPDA